MPSTARMRILVTGATGYIGGRLVPLLLDAGHAVRVLVRDPDRIRGRAWADRVEVHAGDLLDPASLQGAFEGVDAAYYLVHSMCGGADYHERDLRAARHFAEAAAGVGHTIYLGGLVPREGKVSKHLRSRALVGRELRRRLPATEFRAGPIIGSGSASFEMVRYLTERLPVMVAPKWIRNPVMPIAVRDILAYLVAALDAGPQGVVDVGCEALTFRQMMLQFAEARGLKRRIYASPALAPRVASRWVGLVTPLSNNLAGPLVMGIVSPVVGDTAKARRVFPAIEPAPYKLAVERALAKMRAGDVETRWSGALGRESTFRFEDSEGIAREERTLFVPLPPEQAARGFMTIGGERGWLAWRWAWSIRGLMDLVVGGPGLRRGRRHPEHLLPGEALDFWRVEEVDPARHLRLRAEMRLPGRAWLEWEAIPEAGGTRLVQRALFAPKGLAGAAYWYALYPIHLFIFSDMIRAVARNAEELARSPAKG